MSSPHLCRLQFRYQLHQWRPRCSHPWQTLSRSDVLHTPHPVLHVIPTTCDPVLAAILCQAGRPAVAEAGVRVEPPVGEDFTASGGGGWMMSAEVSALETGHSPGKTGKRSTQRIPESPAAYGELALADAAVEGSVPTWQSKRQLKRQCRRHLAGPIESGPWSPCR